MKVFRKTLFVLAGLLLWNGPCRAQDPNFVWTEWETSAVQRQGPQRANGLFVYFHALSLDALQIPIAILFTEMARIAQWDILRINRMPLVDGEQLDGQILGILADEVARARQDGYKRIIVGGVSRGGWLALLAATLPGVDAVIGLASGTGTLQQDDLERTRDKLAQRLTGAKAKRIAAFFFDGDPREAVDERRAVAVRRALQGTRSAYLIVDRPPDLYGHAAAGQGRLVRRYRDCLLQFVQGGDEPAGEVQCSRSNGYAVGSDIGFPGYVGPLKLPPGVSPAVASYWGRWEGDDEFGGYVIMNAVDARGNTIRFRTGYSAAPWVTERRTWMRDILFELDEGYGRLRQVYPRRPLDESYGILRQFDPPRPYTLIELRPISDTDLDFEHVLKNPEGYRTFRRFPLHKRDDGKVDR